MVKDRLDYAVDRLNDVVEELLQMCSSTQSYKEADIVYDARVTLGDVISHLRIYHEREL